MKLNALLTMIAVVELATGIGLLLAPSIIADLLLGDPLGSGVPHVVGRVAGLALIAIGLNCWLERRSNRVDPPTGLLVGLLTYNGAVPLLLVHSQLAYGIGGIGLWPTVVLHLAFAVWLTVSLRRVRSAE